MLSPPQQLMLVSAKPQVKTRRHHHDNGNETRTMPINFSLSSFSHKKSLTTQKAQSMNCINNELKQTEKSADYLADHFMTVPVNQHKILNESNRCVDLSNPTNETTTRSIFNQIVLNRDQEYSKVEHRGDEISCPNPSTHYLAAATDFGRESATNGTVVESTRTSPSASFIDSNSVDIDDVTIDGDESLSDLAYLLKDGGPTEGAQYDDLDVLAQRGSLANNHPGNKWYLRQKRRLQPSYFAASNPQEKTMIAMELVRLVHQRGGRFLRLNRRTGDWCELNAKEAHGKASQALREDLSADDMKKKRLKYPKKKGNA